MRSFIYQVCWIHTHNAKTGSTVNSLVNTELALIYKLRPHMPLWHWITVYDRPYVTAQINRRAQELLNA